MSAFDKQYEWIWNNIDNHLSEVNIAIMMEKAETIDDLKRIIRVMWYYIRKMKKESK
jgi:hypothetical protein